jgi:hypothetical protein
MRRYPDRKKARTKKASLKRVFEGQPNLSDNEKGSVMTDGTTGRKARGGLR